MWFSTSIHSRYRTRCLPCQAIKHSTRLEDLLPRRPLSGFPPCLLFDLDFPAQSNVRIHFRLCFSFHEVDESVYIHNTQTSIQLFISSDAFNHQRHQTSGQPADLLDSHFSMLTRVRSSVKLLGSVSLPLRGSHPAQTLRSLLVLGTKYDSSSSCPAAFEAVTVPTLFGFIVIHRGRGGGLTTHLDDESTCCTANPGVRRSIHALLQSHFNLRLSTFLLRFLVYTHNLSTTMYAHWSVTGIRHQRHDKRQWPLWLGRWNQTLDEVISSMCAKHGVAESTVTEFTPHGTESDTAPLQRPQSPKRLGRLARPAIPFQGTNARVLQ